MNPTNEQELRELAHIIMNADTPYDAMQFVKDHTNAEIARTLDRLESEVQGIATSKPTVDYATSIPTNKVLYTIQAERAKLKGA